MSNEPQPSGTSKPAYANATAAVVNDTPMQLAKRELHGQITDKRFWLGYAAVVAILTVAGPFGTGDDLPWPALLVYWAIIAITTYGVCLFCSVWGTAKFMSLGSTPILAQLMAAVPAGIAAFGVVAVINFAVNFTHPPQPLILLGQCILVALAINVIFLAFEAQPSAPPLQDTQTNLVMDKITHAKRGALIRIETQDHYLEVTTTNGTDLILMRMSDAVAALGDIGIQTHRSHWVAADQITGSTRANNRWNLRLKDGSTVPVSRSYVQTLRDQGHLQQNR